MNRQVSHSLKQYFEVSVSISSFTEIGTTNYVNQGRSATEEINLFSRLFVQQDHIRTQRTL